MLWKHTNVYNINYFILSRLWQNIDDSDAKLKEISDYDVDFYEDDSDRDNTHATVHHVHNIVARIIWFELIIISFYGDLDSLKKRSSNNLCLGK